MKVRLEVSDQEILYHIADVVKNKQRKLSTAECVILDLANKLPSQATSQKGGWAVTDTWRALVREQFGARIEALCEAATVPDARFT